jgi:hypothetical protein
MSSKAYDKLSTEAKEVLVGMVEFCINRGYCMGQDEGLITFEEDTIKLHFRVELERFCKVGA